ncbi:MAG: F0F1 ATP synthase subunit epsilon [Gammaproteobacteria bacterium]
MNTFVINLYDATKQQRIDGVTSFVGIDASGAFGIRAHHARFMTSLVIGLARFRVAGEGWCYLALTGGIVYFVDNELNLATRHFLLDTDLDRVSAKLDQQLRAEEENLRATRESLHRMEQAMVKRMLSLQRKSGWRP